MEPTIDFDQLFALRVMLQDDFENESDIIKELRYELIQLGMTPENIPNFLKNFYEHFGINISLNTINESFNSNSNSNLIPMNFDLLNSLISNLNLSNNIPNNIDSWSNNIDSSSNNIDSWSNNIDSSSNNIDSSSNNIDSSSNTLESTISQESDDDHDLLDDELPPLVYNLNNQIIFNQEFEGIFTNLLQNMYIPPPPPPMEDVVITLNEDELKSLKKYKLDKDLEEKCSICMIGSEKEQEITELHCIHNFHSECIEPYLKEYNYKCPICREEVGKPKFDI